MRLAVLRLLFVLFSLSAGTAFSPPAFALELTRHSEYEVSGIDKELQVKFRSWRDRSDPKRYRTDISSDDDAYVVNVDLFNSRRLTLRVNYSASAMTIKFHHIGLVSPIPLTSRDVAIFTKLLNRLPPVESRAEEALAALLEWVSAASPGMILDINTGQRSSRTSGLQSLCSVVGTNIQAAFDTRAGNIVSRPTRVSQCYEETTECLGKCGEGCGGFLGVPGRVQRFTQDCLNHDFCVRTQGSLIDRNCNNEFLAAADDFLLAPNCADVGSGGTWGDEDGRIYRFRPEAQNGVFGGSIVGAFNCGVYGVSGRHGKDGNLIFTANIRTPKVNCCPSYTVTGQLTSCSEFLGTYENVCGFSGPRPFSRGTVTSSKSKVAPISGPELARR